MRNIVLIADDEKNIRISLSTVLTSEGIDSLQAADGMEAMEMLGSNTVDLVISDIKMPRLDGIGLLKRCKEEYPGVPFVIISAHGTIDTAVEAMKQGALDFFTKPFDNNEVLAVVKKSLEIKNADQAPRISDSERESYNNIVGNSGPMREVYSLIDKVSKADSTVLVTGKSGTGKELVAKTIQEKGPRSKGSFITLNCAAIPETLVESELFGHEKGAFTGAVSAKPGKFELADKGTLFLDEIGEIPITIQPKLLRVLQEGEFERVGGLKTIKSNVRLIAATNRDLEEEVKQGRFREDLFYRLNVIPVSLPSLCERDDDVVILTNYFIDLFNKRMKRKVERADDEILGLFKKYDWPGNIRELENTIERMMVLSDGNKLDMDSMPERIRAFGEVEGEPALAGQSIQNRLQLETDRVEKEYLVKTLEKCGGNRTHAAKMLGVSRKTVQNKIKEFGIG